MEYLVFIAVFVVGLWIIAHKWKLVAWYQYRRPNWMPAACNFCLFFWLGAVTLAVRKIGQPWGLYDLVGLLFNAIVIAVIAVIISKLVGNEIIERK